MLDKIKILTTGRLAEAFKNSVENEFPRNELIIDIYDNSTKLSIDQYNVLAGFNPPEDMNLSAIEWIHSFGAGVNSFLGHSSLNPKTKISRTTGLLGKKIAEYCLCHILAFNQNILVHYRNQKNKAWNQIANKNLYSNSIAILGTGEMGRVCASKLKNLGSKVYGINTTGSQYPEFKMCYSLNDFIKSPPKIDTLISLLPSTLDTIDLLNEDFFTELFDLHLINVGRGDVINESCLIKLINKGVICRATLDVFSTEPLPVESELWNNDKVIITPHQAALTDINDILISFRKAYNTIKQNQNCKLFVDLSKGY